MIKEISAKIDYFKSILYGEFIPYKKIFKDLSQLKTNRKQNLKKSNILLACSVGMNADFFLQTILGKFLVYNNQNVDAILCDGSLKACFNCKFKHFSTPKLQQELFQNGPGQICKTCTKIGKKYLNSSEINFFLYSHFIDETDLKEISNLISELGNSNNLINYKYDDINIGEHAYSAAIRFYSSSEITREKSYKEILLSFIYSGIITYKVFSKIIKKNNYSKIIVDHGIYTPQGIIVATAKKYSVEVFTYATGYRNHTFLFAKKDSYHYSIPELNSNHIPKYKSEELSEIKTYLESRSNGKNDWVLFHENNNVINLNFINREKINITLFTNVLWDANIHFKNSIFKNCEEWLLETINFLSKINKVNLHIRIHPGENKGFIKSRQSCEELLKNQLDEKVIKKINIISSDTNLNSYELAKKSDFSIVYASKIGIELAALGFPVIITGDCWIRNKGITFDPLSKEEYFQKLNYFVNNKVRPLPDKLKALEFARFIFFDCMKELKFIEKTSGNPPFKINLKKLKQEDKNINNLINFIVN